MNGLFQATTLPVLGEVAHFAEARHAVLAGNVANMSTPGYRVRDLSVDSFQTQLREALEAQREPAARHSPGRMSKSRQERLREVRDSVRGILFHDGSDVGVEQQITELSKNQMMHNLAIQLMQQQFQLLKTAISERIPA